MGHKEKVNFTPINIVHEPIYDEHNQAQWDNKTYNGTSGKS